MIVSMIVSSEGGDGVPFLLLISAVVKGSQPNSLICHILSHWKHLRILPPTLTLSTMCSTVIVSIVFFSMSLGVASINNSSSCPYHFLCVVHVVWRTITFSSKPNRITSIKQTSTISGGMFSTFTLKASLQKMVGSSTTSFVFSRVTKCILLFAASLNCTSIVPYFLPISMRIIPTQMGCNSFSIWPCVIISIFSTFYTINFFF